MYNSGKQEIDAKRTEPLQFEDALDIAGFGKFNFYMIILCGVILNCVFYETVGVSYVIPVAQCDIQLSNQLKGLLGAAGFAGIICSSHLWGFLADTRGRRKVMLPTLIASFVITVISSFIEKAWIFTLLRFVNGFFISGSAATVYAYLGEFHNNQQRSRAIMVASIAYGIICLLLPIIAWSVMGMTWTWQVPLINLTFKPWRLFIIICGLPSLLCATALALSPESPKFLLSQGKNEDALNVLKLVYRINTGKTKDTFPGKAIIDYATEGTLISRSGKWKIFQTMWDQTIPLFKKPYLKITLIGCVLQFGIFATCHGLNMWFPDIVNSIETYTIKYPNGSAPVCDIIGTSNGLNVDTDKCNEKIGPAVLTLTVILEIAYASGYFIIGLIIHLVGSLPIILFLVIGCGVCAIPCIFIESPEITQYLILVLLLCGLSANVLTSAVVDLIPTHLRAMAVSLTLMVGRIGALVGSSLIGFLLDYNCSMTFILSGGSLIACGVLAIFIPKPNNKDVDSKRETSDVNS